jgi:hypothetical protein
MIQLFLKPKQIEEKPGNNVCALWASVDLKHSKYLYFPVIVKRDYFLRDDGSRDYPVFTKNSLFAVKMRTSFRRSPCGPVFRYDHNCCCCFDAINPFLSRPATLTDY